MIRGLRYALSLFTVLPVDAPAPTRRDARWAMAFAPLVGLAMAVVAGLVVFGTRWAAPSDATPVLAATAGIATMALLSRGLHLDGLADTADALGAGRVLDRGDVGPFAVVTVLLVLLLQVSCLAAAITVGRGTAAMLVSAMTGRLAATMSCTPRTTALGDGLGARVVGTVPRLVALAEAAAATVAAYVLGAIDEGVGLNGGLHAAAAVILALAAAHALRHRASRRLGGVNGDVLGAQVEIAMTVVLMVFAVQRGRIR